MLIGYNNDVEHRGKTFHIQTEDRGSSGESIESQLFCGGAILDTKITSYSELVAGLEGKERDQRVQSLMQASHRSLFKRLMAGEYDAMVGLEPLSEVGAEVSATSFEPGQDGVPQAAIALEQGEIEEPFDPGGGDHMGLSALKDKLASLKERSSSVSEVEERESSEPETTILESPPDLMERIEPQRLKERLLAGRGAEEVDGGGFAPTGVKAWTGCEAPREDLSLTALVQDFLAG